MAGNGAQVREVGPIVGDGLGLTVGLGLGGGVVAGGVVGGAVVAVGETEDDGEGVVALGLGVGEGLCVALGVGVGLPDGLGDGTSPTPHSSTQPFSRFRPADVRVARNAAVLWSTHHWPSSVGAPIGSTKSTGAVCGPDRWDRDSAPATRSNATRTAVIPAASREVCLLGLCRPA
jgi:hypothetical protein